MEAVDIVQRRIAPCRMIPHPEHRPSGRPTAPIRNPASGACAVRWDGSSAPGLRRFPCINCILQSFRRRRPRCIWRFTSPSGSAPYSRCIRPSEAETGPKPRRRRTWFSPPSAAALYWVYQFDGLVRRVGNFTPLDYAVGGIVIVSILEAARRVVGVPLVVIALLALLYALLGDQFSGFLQHRGYDWDRIVSQMVYTTEGVFGTPLQVSAKFVFLFLLFGEFLERTGVGAYFNELALAVAGRSVGSPAKVAVFSSALQGTISGSSVANVVTSGTFTIPLMKRLGYHKDSPGRWKRRPQPAGRSCRR